MDATVIKIARLSTSFEQIASSNNFKPKKSLKFQTITSLDEFTLHVAGPIEGRRPDFALYVQSSTEKQLTKVCKVNDKQYFVKDDSGYNRRNVHVVPFRRANATVALQRVQREVALLSATLERSYMRLKLYSTTAYFKTIARERRSTFSLFYKCFMLPNNICNCLYSIKIFHFYDCSLLENGDNINQKEYYITIKFVSNPVTFLLTMWKDKERK